MKLSREFGWRDEGKTILNETYLGYDDLRKGNIYYKDACIDYIKQKLRDNKEELFQKILTEKQYAKAFS